MNFRKPPLDNRERNRPFLYRWIFQQRSGVDESVGDVMHRQRASGVFQVLAPQLAPLPWSEHLGQLISGEDLVALKPKFLHDPGDLGDGLRGWAVGRSN